MFHATGPKSRARAPRPASTWFGAAFNAPTVIAMVQWHVQHNYRTGADVHPAIPYVAVAFLFEGDIIPWGKP